jgi:hypothetical protein
MKMNAAPDAETNGSKIVDFVAFMVFSPPQVFLGRRKNTLPPRLVSLDSFRQIGAAAKAWLRRSQWRTQPATNMAISQSR